MMNNFVDISSMKQRRSGNIIRHKTIEHTEKTIKEIYYELNGKRITYDDRTMKYYKTMRQCHIDPILNIEVNDKIAFKFDYQWDAYTGERTIKDPFGPLYFNPISLVYNYYIHRLDGLWKNECKVNGEYFEGYYDMLVGVGESMNIIGRGYYPELYLFRLPILDCYLTTDHNKSIITFGPKLNDTEINIIEQLCLTEEVKTEYMNIFGKNCPSIKTMKLLYDNAISNTVNESIKKYNIPQHYYVDQLKKL